MKMITTLVFLSLSLSAMASNIIENSSWVKVADGTSAYCRNMADVMRNKNQAYSLRNKQVNVVSETINVSMDVVFFHCQNQGDRFGFALVNPYDNYFFENYSLARGERTIEVSTDELEIIVYRDGIYKILYKDILADDLKVNMNFSLDELLTQQELDALNAGESVKASYDFMINRKTHNKRLASSSKGTKNIIRYGSFRQWLTLKKVNGKLLVRRVL